MLAKTENRSLRQAIIEPRPLDQNPAAVYIASLSPGSRRTMRQALDVIAGLLTGNADCLSCNWAALRYQHTTAVRAKLAENYSPATASKMLVALRRVLHEAWRLGQMSAANYEKARDIASVKGESLLKGRGLQSGEVRALLEVCENDPSPAGMRDAAVIAVMYQAGLRRAEVVSLDLENYDPETGMLEILHAKRNKQRTAYLTNGAVLAVADWLAVRGNEPGPLFHPINKSKRIQNKRLSDQAIYYVLVERAEQAGVKDVSPHDLRRTFVSDLLDAGADISTVAKMAGHSNVSTTSRYDRRGEVSKQKAAGLLHVPYHGSKKASSRKS